MVFDVMPAHLMPLHGGGMALEQLSSLIEYLQSVKKLNSFTP